jgi:putative phosphoesterase
MKLGIISDIHGNLPALEAVLAELAGESVDRIVCLGDVAALGPQPREVVARLRALGCPVVMGNTDAALFEPPTPAAGAAETQDQTDDIAAWGAAQLASEELAYLRSFQPTVTLDLDGHALLCYHGSPRSFVERITPETPDDDLAEMLAGHPATLYAGGHTHSQMLRRHREALVLNPGAVGLAVDAVPFARARYHMAWAEYAVVTVRGARLEVALHRTPFDLDALRAAAAASGMPHAAAWAADWRAP